MINTVRIMSIAIATLGTQAGFAAAEQPPLAPFLGHWSQPCDAFGVPARCSSVWSHGKHPSHLVQDYAIVRQSDQAQIFAGRGVYRFEGGQVEGSWEDSQGAIHRLAGTYQDEVLKVTWGSVSTEIGRSEYVHEDGTLSVRDSVLREQGWHQFMAVDYQRAGQHEE